jgi:hypothetical protein
VAQGARPGRGPAAAGGRRRSQEQRTPDDPAILDQTRGCLRDAQRLLADKPDPREFYDQMRDRYPDRLDLGPLWYGALGLLG